MSKINKQLSRTTDTDLINTQRYHETAARFQNFEEIPSYSKKPRQESNLKVSTRGLLSVQKGPRYSYFIICTSRPLVNFINGKRTNYLYERYVSAAFFSYMYVEKQCLYEKFVHKMLMKLTPCYPYL